MRRKDTYTEAWNITWRYKFLWIFGFIAGITLNTKSGTTDFFSNGAWLFQNIGLIIGNNSGVTLFGVALLAILLWLLGLVSRADLIHGSAKIINKGKQEQISFKMIFSPGLHSLPKLAGMQVIVWLPVTFLAGWSMLQGSGLPINENNFSFLNFASISTLAMMSTILTLALSFVDAFAFRSIVLNGASILGSIYEAGQILRHNLGKILTIAVVCVIIGLVVSLIIGLPLAPVMALLMAPITGLIQEAMKQCMSNHTEYEAISKCVQGIRASSTTFAFLLPTNVILAAFYSVWTTFLSTVFTILYGDIAGFNVRRRKP